MHFFLFLKKVEKYLIFSKNLSHLCKMKFTLFFFNYEKYIFKIYCYLCKYKFTKFFKIVKYIRFQKIIFGFFE